MQSLSRTALERQQKGKFWVGAKFAFLPQTAQLKKKIASRGKFSFKMDNFVVNYQWL